VRLLNLLKKKRKHETAQEKEYADICDLCAGYGKEFIVRCKECDEKHFEEKLLERMSK